MSVFAAKIDGVKARIEELKQHILLEKSRISDIDGSGLSYSRAELTALSSQPRVRRVLKGT